MKLYAKCVDEDKQEYRVINQIEAQKSGWDMYDLEYGWDGKYYLSGYVPIKPPETKKEIEVKRRKYYALHLDNLTLNRIKQQSLGEWTEEEESEYLLEAQKVKEKVKELFPYPVENLEEGAEK